MGNSEIKIEGVRINDIRGRRQMATITGDYEIVRLIHAKLIPEVGSEIDGILISSMSISVC